MRVLLTNAQPNRYFQFMPSHSRRCLSCISLLVGALWVPSIGVAHGLAHHREAHHDAAAHHNEPNDRREPHSTSAALDWATLGETEHHDGHSDPVMDEGVPTRMDSPLAVLPRAPRAMLSLTITVAAHARTTHAALPRVDPHTGPPPKLRAPPTV